MSDSLKKKKTVSWKDTAKDAATLHPDNENKMLIAPKVAECDEDSVDLEKEDEKHKHQ